MLTTAVLPLAVSGMPLAVHGFVLGYEPIAEAVSLRGGSARRYLLEPVTAAAVEYQDGWILLDSGFDLSVVRDDRRRGELLNYDSYTPVVPPGDPLRDSVAAAGLEWGRLAGCAISHAHLDHTGGLRLVPTGVPVILQRREWEWVVAGAGRADVVIGADLLDVGDRIVPLDGDTTLAGGLRALDTSGHTPGHQSFMVDLASGRSLVLACDAADLRANVETRTPCGWTPGGDGEARAQSAIDRLADLDLSGIEVWPGHDPQWAPWAAAMNGDAIVIR